MAKSYSTVAVIGGGASGILAALTAAQEPARHVLLLEKQQRIGRKLLATGNGRCNLSNWNATPDAYFGSDAAFAAPALQAFSPMDTHRYFSRLGLLTVTEEGGGSIRFPILPTACWTCCVLRSSVQASICAVLLPWTASAVPVPVFNWMSIPNR